MERMSTLCHYLQGLLCFLLCRCYLEHVRTVQLTDNFLHHKLAPFVGNICKPYYHFPNKELHCTIFMMSALRRQVSSDLNELVHRTNSPFMASVTSFPFPPKFRIKQVESYDRSKNPLDHLESFKTLMHLQGVVDEIMCKAFPTTLKGPARIWFSKLTPNSISTFKELST